MNKISCEIVLDLLPLVKDNVASEQSKKLVKEHIETCESCKEFYDSFTRERIIMDDSKVIFKIKKQLFITLTIIIIAASMLGLALSESMGMFYNILIMPFIGGLGYFAFDEKSYLLSTSIFIFSYVWLFIKYIGEGMLVEQNIWAVITIPIGWSIIYTALVGIGIFIAFLLKYAFRKDENHEN